MIKKLVYKVIFVNRGQVYEIYAKQVNQGILLGFVEVEGLFFGEKSEVVIDPTEERLKTEFSGVERTYIPMNSVIRIDAVEKRGVSRVTALPSKSDNVMPFPSHHLFPPNNEEPKKN